MKATGCKKIYNAENIIEAEMLVEMLKENGIAAFTQEPSSSVAAYGVAGFGVYGVDIWAERGVLNPNHQKSRAHRLKMAALRYCQSYLYSLLAYRPQCCNK